MSRHIFTLKLFILLTRCQFPDDLSPYLDVKMLRSFIGRVGGEVLFSFSAFNSNPSQTIAHQIEMLFLCVYQSKCFSDVARIVCLSSETGAQAVSAENMV